MTDTALGPRFPLYIPSKGRSEYMVTSRALTAMGVRHTLVVEPQEFEAYKRAAEGLLADVVELDMNYKSTYDLCDSYGLSKSTGSGPARNFIWDLAANQGAEWHWIMDDNIKHFCRRHGNRRLIVHSAVFWRIMEDFVLRYENIAMAGPSYEMFGFASYKRDLPPFHLNTRIYSCNLIRTSLPLRWRGRYNEDTILSLDLLKAGWCTVLFNALLQGKMGTTSLPGGNTTELYAAGTLEKSQMLYREHPDVTKVIHRFGRTHHYVNYGVFKNRRLIKCPDAVVPETPNNYGLKLVKLPQPIKFTSKRATEFHK